MTYSLTYLRSVRPDEGIKSRQNCPKSSPKIVTSDYSIQIVTLLKWPKKFNIFGLLLQENLSSRLFKKAQSRHTAYVSSYCYKSSEELFRLCPLVWLPKLRLTLRDPFWRKVGNISHSLIGNNDTGLSPCASHIELMQDSVPLRD